MNTSESMPTGPAGRRLRPAFVLALGLVLGLWGGVAFDRVTWDGSVPQGATADFRLMAEAWNRIQTHYVDRKAVKNTTLTYGAIGGMVDALGDTGHSTFLSPEMVKELKESQRGRLKGIGVEIQMKQGRVVVVAPLDNSPAQRAGLKAGEVIVQVNGQVITGLPISQVVARITGKPGTSVNLTILDPHSGHTRDTTIERASIQLHTITWRTLPGTTIAHLRVASFEEDTDQGLRQALAEIKQAHSTGIILDLRNNPGGILHQAVLVASQFLTGGNVLLVKDAQGHEKPVPVKHGGLATTIPMAILINDGSASGAEIVAGALKDADRGPLIGQKTFGTGTVLQQFPLSDGSALLLAVEEWLTPDGHSFWHKGIEPNVVVALPQEAHILLPETEADMSPAQLHSSDDKQLLRALALLTHPPEAKK